MLNFKSESWQFGTWQESVSHTQRFVHLSKYTVLWGLHVSSAFLQAACCSAGCMPCLQATHRHCVHIPTCISLRNRYLTFSSQTQFHPGLGTCFLLRSLMSCRPPAAQVCWIPAVSAGALQPCPWTDLSQWLPAVKPRQLRHSPVRGSHSSAWPLQGQGRQWGNPKNPGRQRLQRCPSTSRRQEHCPVTWSHSALSEPCGWHSQAGKHRKQSRVLKVFLPTHLMADAAQRQQGWKMRYSWKRFLYCFTHNPVFKALKIGVCVKRQLVILVVVLAAGHSP